MMMATIRGPQHGIRTGYYVLLRWDSSVDCIITNTTSALATYVQPPLSPRRGRTPSPTRYARRAAKRMPRLLKRRHEGKPTNASTARGRFMGIRCDSFCIEYVIDCARKRSARVASSLRVVKNIHASSSRTTRVSVHGACLGARCA